MSFAYSARARKHRVHHQSSHLLAEMKAVSYVRLLNVEMLMRQRGSKYKHWIEGGLITENHSEILPGGIQLHASTHVPAGSPIQLTLIFIGLYSAVGTLIYEECYGTRDSSSSAALAWATEMGKARLANTC